ncbi:endoflagellar motor protein [Leptospira perolatii]|uniref:Endoflagellar motor protein n=1 Tax=Leptospira perolatii TaxID=2023191 RepID=A0A2M9ZJR5_9LEPT|nr:OmpA family protein [Leptospira perolatii]PJZ69471.1 endoflagellar motor protein [Leptospira perolatii]PJZ72296.1 endoflagellar motor protein [Leptospira perolatii]
MIRQNLTRLITILVFLQFSPVSGDAFYYPWEYNKLYNEKVTLELELDSLKNRYRNETDNFSKEKVNLEGKIRSLEELLASEKSFRQKDKDLYEDQLKGLENQIAVLKAKSSNKEKELLEESEKQSRKFQDIIADLKSELEKEKLSCIKKNDDLKKEYEAKIAGLESRINSLNDEIAKLERLSESQKQELNRLADQANELESKLTDEIKKGQIRVKRFHNRLVINIDDQISFDSGSAELKKQIMPALDKIKEILASYPGNLIIIEGHTDNVPIRTKKFQDNWQLSSERGLSVLRYLLENKSLDSRNFSVAGYGEHQPIVSNDTPENRSLNRRVDIVVVPR